MPNKKPKENQRPKTVHKEGRVKKLIEVVTESNGLPWPKDIFVNEYEILEVMRPGVIDLRRSSTRSSSASKRAADFHQAGTRLGIQNTGLNVHYCDVTFISGRTVKLYGRPNEILKILKQTE